MEDMKGANTEETKKLFLFEIDGELYAVAVEAVDRVMKIPPITPIPNAPRAIIGIFHLRGKVILALDLASRMNIPKVKPLSQNFLFVVRHGKDQFAILIDKPKIIMEVPVSAIRPPDPIIAAHVPIQYIEGIFTHEDVLPYHAKEHRFFIEPKEEGGAAPEAQKGPPRPVLWLSLVQLFDHDDLERVLASQE